MVFHHLFALMQFHWGHEPKTSCARWNGQLNIYSAQKHWKTLVTHTNTHPLLVWIHISDAKIVFLQQVEVVADEVKQILTLCVPLWQRKGKNWNSAKRVTPHQKDDTFKHMWTLSREKMQQRKVTVVSSNMRNNSSEQNVLQIFFFFLNPAGDFSDSSNINPQPKSSGVSGINPRPFWEEELKKRMV